jgi:P4 family phage/plasmid primase-like protien
MRHFQRFEWRKSMRLHIDTCNYKNKPTDQIGTIKKRVQSNTSIRDLEVDDIVLFISNGFTISPGVLIGGLKADNWTEQRLFMVDVDNCNPSDEILSVEHALEICRANNISPAFYYYSYSHSESHPKYRLCFVMEDTIYDKQQRSMIIRNLVNLFSQSDKSCINADRIFFGTNKAVVILDKNAVVEYQSILSIYNELESETSISNQDRNSVFFEFLRKRNGGVSYSNDDYAKFNNCELCGHHQDLVFYFRSNSFFCFGANINSGGGFIEYLMILHKCSRKIAKEYLASIYANMSSLSGANNLCVGPKLSGSIINNELLEKISKQNPHENYSLNDKGISTLFSEIYKDKCRFNVSANEWYVFNGKVWVEDKSSLMVLRMMKEFSDTLLIFATKISNENTKITFLNYVKRLGSLKFRELIIRDSRDNYFIRTSDLNRNPNLFNCQNGTLDLSTFEFRLHCSEDLLSKISNVYYDPTNESTSFEDFVSQILENDIEKIQYLQKILGYSLTTDTSLETCFILYGPTSRNGKSTLVETYAYMMGSENGYAMNIQPQTLAYVQNRDSRQASGDIARLNGCRFLNSSEPPQSMIFDVPLVKALLGRDTITARNLHEREFEFKPAFKLFINTNHLPLISDDMIFASGRINVITFDRHFNSYEQNPKLKDLLTQKENISGMFNWCLDGLRKFIAQGLQTPDSIQEATNNYRLQSDKIARYFSECLRRSSKNTSAKEVYENYIDWCIKHNYSIEPKKMFFTDLTKRNLLKGHGTVNGLSVRNVIAGYEINDFSLCEEIFS